MLETGSSGCLALEAPLHSGRSGWYKAYSYLLQRQREGLQGHAEEEVEGSRGRGHLHYVLGSPRDPWIAREDGQQ